MHRPSCPGNPWVVAFFLRLFPFPPFCILLNAYALIVPVRLKNQTLACQPGKHYCLSPTLEFVALLALYFSDIEHTVKTALVLRKDANATPRPRCPDHLTDSPVPQCKTNHRLQFCPQPYLHLQVGLERLFLLPHLYLSIYSLVAWLEISTLPFSFARKALKPRQLLPQLSASQPCRPHVALICAASSFP